MTRRDWRNYTLGRSTRGVKASKTESIIREWIKTYMNEADTTIKALDLSKALKSTLDMNDENRGKLQMIMKRWRQIRELCEQALMSLSC